jgi:hypothetical protein
METRSELDLLVDLAKLVKRYGPGPFEQLAESICSPDLAQRLSRILSELSQHARMHSASKARSHQRQGPCIPKALVDLQEKDPDRYTLLKGFYEDLTARVVMPSIRDIREFARDCRFPDVRAESRQKAIGPLIGALCRLDLPKEELAARIESAKRYDATNRSLAGWSSIILNRHQS